MSSTFSVAPGVKFTERDATLATSSNLAMTAGHAGRFQWGPMEQVVAITGGETELVDVFYKPSLGASGIDQLVLLDYFSYSNSAYVVRVPTTGALNSIASGGTDTTIKNKLELDNYAGLTPEFAKYPGALGDNLAIMVIDETLRAEIKADYDLGFRDGNASIWGLLNDKDPLGVDEYNVIVYDTSGAISGNVSADFIDHKTLTFVLDAGVTATPTLTLGETSFPIELVWDGVAVPTTIGELLARYVELFEETSSVQKSRNGIRAMKLVGSDKLEFEFFNSVPEVDSWFSYDVLDFTSVTEESIVVESLGYQIELFERISTVEGSTDPDTGLPNSFKETVNVNSSYVGFGPAWGTGPTIGYTALEGGSDGTNPDFYTAYDLLRTKKSLMLGIIDVCIDIGTSQNIIDTALSRRDCVAFTAPLAGLVQRTTNTLKFKYLKEWRDSLLRNNSYFVMTDNWAEFYDKYNKVYRKIPTTGGTCGVWFRSIANVGAGKSPAFLNRGKYKNYRSMDWEASEDQIKVLYNDYQINSIIEEESSLVLWGDRTGLSKKSAFNRINVRGVFIDCEVAIAATAKYVLGENNDVFTRTSFDNSVEPFLRGKKENGEIEDYYLKTDEQNNSAQVVVNNEFVSGIYIKPKYSINFIYLDFVAVRPDVQFSEVEVAG